MKKGVTPRTIRTTPEEDKVIAQVQAFFGVDDFSAMTLKLYQDKWTEIQEKKEQFKSFTTPTH